ncbi:LysR family transcriptional regulator [Algiphilus sp.]|uniref:LysR family transcriptional regulator n=1 Tax=Algiphilus sp. TaxID=1872431 RepID=UPI0025BCA520|nr:LysR family transcriptional regulator [Algiphilus sp.]MCK5769519.1 LysR family transcriptional regulator [Algiphilus sp.]
MKDQKKAIDPQNSVIESRRLFYFYHVAKHGRFVAAEAALGVAQSAMSRQIQQLEASLGVPLLVRNGHGVTLTEFGEILYRHAEDILTRMASSLAELSDAADKSGGSVSIAAPPTFTSVYMVAIIDTFQQQYPNVRIRAVEGSTGSVMSQLSTGEVDCAIVLQPKKAGRTLQKKLLSEPVCIICSPDHPVADQKFVPRAQLRELDLILPASLHGSRALLREYFDGDDIPLRAHIEADSLTLTRNLVMQKKVCTILPASACEEQIAEGTLVSVPLKPTLSRELFIARLSDRTPSAPAEALMSIVVDVVKGARRGGDAAVA